MRSSRLFNLRYVLALILLLSSCVYTSAFDFFEEDGVYYRNVGNSAVEVVVGVSTDRGGTLTHHYTTGDVVIPPRLASGAKVIGIGYNALSGVSSVSLPATIRYIEENAFGGGISEIFIPKSVTRIENGAFSYCSKLETIEVDSANTVFDSREGCNAIIRTADNMLIASSRNTKIPGTVAGIEKNAFYCNKSITTLDIPNSVTYIGEYAFFGCSRMRELSLSSNLKIVGDYAFYGCDSIMSNVVVPENIVSIGERSFCGIDGITNLTFNDSLEYMGDGAFAACKNLETVTYTSNNDSIPYFELKYSMNKFGGFQNCVNLRKLVLSKTVVLYHGLGLKGCNNLELIMVEPGNPMIDSRNNCNGVVLYSIPSHKSGEEVIVTGEPPYTKLVVGCKNTVIPEDVSRIGGHAFVGDMWSVTIPEHVKTIDNYAFYNCVNIKDVYMCSAVPPEVTQPLDYTDGGSFYFPKSITLHVPKGAKEAYSDPALDWCLFGNIVEWSPSAIDEIEIDDVLGDDGEAAEYYNLQGVKVENPANGVFIKKQGEKTAKVVL